MCALRVALVVVDTRVRPQSEPAGDGVPVITTKSVILDDRDPVWIAVCGQSAFSSRHSRPSNPAMQARYRTVTDAVAIVNEGNRKTQVCAVP